MVALKTLFIQGLLAVTVAAMPLARDESALDVRSQGPYKIHGPGCGSPICIKAVRSQEAHNDNAARAPVPKHRKRLLWCHSNLCRKDDPSQDVQNSNAATPRSTDESALGVRSEDAHSQDVRSEDVHSQDVRNQDNADAATPPSTDGSEIDPGCRILNNCRSKRSQEAQDADAAVAPSAKALKGFHPCKLGFCADN